MQALKSFRSIIIHVFPDMTGEMAELAEELLYMQKVFVILLFMHPIRMSQSALGISCIPIKALF